MLPFLVSGIKYQNLKTFLMLIKSTLLLGVVSISIFTFNHKISPKNTAERPVVKNLSNQHLNRLPQEIFVNYDLRVLDVSRNDIRELDTRMMSNKSLVELNLSYNPRLNIEHVVDYLPDSSLQYLNLEACHLPIIPVGMERFSKLRQLDLSDNHLVYLPYDMSQLSKLESIDLRNNNIEDLDQCPYGWYNLKEIDVRGNQKLRHKEFIRALTILDELRLVKMGDVEEVGSSFSELSSRRVEIHDSPLLKFDGELAENQGIQELYLNQSLSKRPKAILQEVNQCLNLSKLKITEDWTKIPKYIQVLNTITDLDLSGNNISDVSALKKLTALKKLNLNNNPISEEALKDLQAALPNCKVRFEMASTDKPLKISKPIPSAKLKVEKNTVKPNQASEVEFTTAKLSVPENAFVDKDGKVITTPVKLEYTEYMNPAQIMLSGIPMSYDSAGVRYNFSSAGMFELNASSNGKAVFPNPDKPISVEMTSSSNDTDYNLYAYDSTKGSWELLGKDEVTADFAGGAQTESESMTLSKSKVTARRVSDSITVYPDEAMRAYLNKMSKYQARFSQNKLSYPKIRAKVKNNKKTNSFTIDIHKLLMGKSNHPVSSTKRLRTLSGKWIYEGENAKETMAFLDSIDAYSMRIYSEYRNRGIYGYRGPSFIKNVSLKPADDGNTFLLSFMYKDTLLELNVYPEMDDYTSQRQVKKNFLTFNRYLSRAKNDQRIEKTNKRNIKRENRKILREMRRDGLDENLESLMVFDVKAAREKLVGKKMLASEYLDTKAKPTEASRTFQLYGFGVFNCDRIQRMANPMPVYAKFTNGKGGLIKADKVYVLEFDANGVLSYDGGETFKVDKGTNFNIILVMKNDRMAIVSSNALDCKSLRKSSTRIPVEVIKTTDMTTEEMIKKMMS